MRTCKTCGEEKPLSEFYEKNIHCRECRRIKTRQYRKDLRENLPAYAKHQRKYNRSYYLKNKEKIKANQRANYDPIKHAAQKLTNVAIKRGELIRPDNCSICNSSKRIQAHHPDYLKPLEVEWLCQACHSYVHAQSRSYPIGYKNSKPKPRKPLGRPKRLRD